MLSCCCTLYPRPKILEGWVWSRKFSGIETLSLAVEVCRNRKYAPPMVSIYLNNDGCRVRTAIFRRQSWVDFGVPTELLYSPVTANRKSRVAGPLPGTVAHLLCHFGLVSL